MIVFKGEKEEVDKRKLEEEIFEEQSVDVEDKIGEWEENNEEIRKRKRLMKGKELREIKLKGKGKDMKVGIEDGNEWNGGE